MAELAEIYLALPLWVIGSCGCPHSPTVQAMPDGITLVNRLLLNSGPSSDSGVALACSTPGDYDA